MYLRAKRVLDILLAAFALLILSPIFILTSLILLFTGERTIFYRQKRIGRNSRPFYVYKFATMLKNSLHIGNREITLKNDFRVTRVGKILRSSKINELPQLLNVLKGDMSIVGPRPLVEASYKLYPESQREMIFQNRPGITGMGSIVFRDEEKIMSEAEDPRKTYEAIFPYKAALELWYRQHISFKTDVKIMFLTGWAIVFPRSVLIDRFFEGLPVRNHDLPAKER